MMKKKTIKTPSVVLMLLQGICAQCHDSGFESKLLRHSHTTGHTTDVVQAPRRKNRENRGQSHVCMNYAEVHPVFAGSRNPASLKNHFSRHRVCMNGCAAGFLGFSLMRKSP